MRKLILSLIALWLAALPVQAASRAETRALTEAYSSFRAEIWERAEKEFGAFADKYRASTNLPMAILLQAEARIQLGRLANAIDLLSAHFIQSGDLADQYLFWMAQANFQSGNYLAAADTFARVTQGFPKSSRWLEAIFWRANAYSKLEQWTNVVDLLSNTNGSYQLAANAKSTNELIIRGGLLLAQAQSALKNYDAAELTLTSLTNTTASLQLSWQRRYLLCQVQLADDRADEALTGTDELLKLAGTSALRAESIALWAKILEELGRLSDAITAYQRNLGDTVPVKYQQQASFKIAGLSQSLGRLPDAVEMLGKFLSQNTNSPVADFLLLTLGDLQLKQYLATRDMNRPPEETTNTAATNFLQAALVRYQAVVEGFPNSHVAGKALLNEGWCFWFSGEMTNSLNAFQAAAFRLTAFSEDQLVARFKWAETQSRLKDFAGAITNYNFIVAHASTNSSVQAGELIEPALYQLLHASLDVGDAQSADAALAKILDWYPNGFFAERSLLLAGQGFILRPEPVRARDYFMEFEKRFPNSIRLPEARLAIARTYEQQGSWTNAIQQYDDWLATFTDNPARPHVEYYRGWANFQAGNETNALMLFTNFMSRFPNDPLAPSAQLWIGDHYFRAGDYVNAERSYQSLYLTWPSLRLAYEAWMMAGRSAVARLSPDAIYYFTNLTSDVNCPLDVRAQALFAYGDAKMSMEASGTNKQVNLERAISIFGQIPPTNSLYAAAMGRVGDCYLQLGIWNPKRYDLASNVYQQVLTIPSADATTRSQAKMGLGVVAEKQAQLKPEAEQSALVNLALNHYVDVFHGVILREVETPDPFWTKKAGLEAARVEESLKQWPQVIGIYEQMKTMFPSLVPWLDKKIANVMAQMNPERTTN